MKQWDENVVANHFKLLAIEIDELSSETRMMVASNKGGIYYLKEEICGETHQFLEELTHSVLSTIVARPNNGQD